MHDTNESKRQENLLKIEEKLHEYLHQYNNNFDTVAYTKIALEHLKTNTSLEQLNVSDFVNKNNNINDKNDSTYNNDKQCFHLIKDGDNLVVVGSDGTILDGKSFEETNDKVCQQFIQRDMAEGKESVINFQSNDPEKLKIFSRNAIIKFGITVGDGYPEDPNFWQSLRNEYLNNENNSIQDWERMTRLIPDNIMQRTAEEKKRNQQLIKELADKKTNNKNSDFLKQLRNGSNPNHESPTPPQNNNQPDHPKKIVPPRNPGHDM